MFILNRNTQIVSSLTERPIQLAIRNLKRDLKKACHETKMIGGEIVLVNGKQKTECFRIWPDSDRMYLEAADTLGFVYGLYEISRTILGIHPFWFWNDQQIISRDSIEIESNFVVQSEPFAVSLRGWFVNDEVLLHTWKLYGSKDAPWEMVFEALIRCGGNMVIPGTDRNAHRYRRLASDMGLWITHHHAEPLGAEMFSRAYPEDTPSFEQHPDQFLDLWKTGIESQKDMHIVWNLGFRGQGDRPFWEDDPRYLTPESRGAIMSRLITMQYDLVKESDPSAVCCTNLYGETMELYQQGHLKLPEDVIKIWADNGYGKMVSRRQGNTNPRIVSLPDVGDCAKKGIYYHVSFYDLQAANHITMLPNSPELVCEELRTVLEHGGNTYWMINCSNVKPHVYFLDLIAQIWKSGSVSIEEHRKQYAQMYYGKLDAASVAQCIADYHKYAVLYGSHEDEHAGEQFANHVARILVYQYRKDSSTAQPDLIWATDEESLAGQITWYQTICRQAELGYQKYVKECEAAVLMMQEQTAELMRDSILLQAKIYAACFSGANEVCTSLLLALGHEYQSAFYHAGVGRERYLFAYNAMKEREHGKWQGFYDNECLTDIRQTAWVLEGLMSDLRNLGDGPHFFAWKRKFMYPEEDRDVMLVLTMENHLTDLELFACMKQHWEK